MPKDNSIRSVSQEHRSCASPFSYKSSNCGRRASSSSSQNPAKAPISAADVKEWDDARCPICMEHPHNAVMLLCASNQKGCHAYMCDTSYRHSNCLDQFRKNFCGQASSREQNDEHDQPKLYCPLCRGNVKGFMVVEDARNYMNAKARSCSSESCAYGGTYEDLRKHARRDHPFLRPARADPERQRSWRRMERQHDINDLLSSMRSSLGMEEADFEVADIDMEYETDRSLLRSSSFAPVTLYIFIEFLGTESPNVLRFFSRAHQSTTARPQSAGQRRLWGETFNEEVDSTSAHAESDASEEDSLPTSDIHRPRTRRRIMRHLDDED